MSGQASLQQLARGLSHEILNPLAGIKAALEVLRETEKLSRDGEQIGNEINNEVEQIDRVVRQFLEYSFCPEPRPEDLPFDALVQSAHDQLSGKPVDFKVKMSGPRGLRVRADLVMLQRVLIEVIQNMVDNGAHLASVTVRPGVGKIVIHVRNQGPPIDRGIATRIFEPFFSTKPGRAGLGLSIAQRWLTAMGGTIKLLPARDGFEIILPGRK